MSGVVEKEKEREAASDRDGTGLQRIGAGVSPIMLLNRSKVTHYINIVGH